jgi:hypothetical protein
VPTRRALLRYPDDRVLPWRLGPTEASNIWEAIKAPPQRRSPNSKPKVVLVNFRDVRVDNSGERVRGFPRWRRVAMQVMQVAGEFHSRSPPWVRGQ